MKDLAGKTAVITGAASGMGRAFAERFAAAGMNIVLADVEVPRLEEATASVSARGVEAIAVPTDVSDAEAVERLRDAALARFGRVHVVCNNAGVAGSMGGAEHRSRRLALGPRCQPVGRRPRPPLLPPPPPRARRRPHRQHGVDGRPLPRTQRLLGEQVGGGRPHRGPLPAAADAGFRRSASRACARGGSPPTSRRPTATARSGPRRGRSRKQPVDERAAIDPRVRPRPAQQRDGAGRASPTSCTTRSSTTASGSSPTWPWSPPLEPPPSTPSWRAENPPQSGPIRRD